MIFVTYKKDPTLDFDVRFPPKVDCDGVSVSILEEFREDVYRVGSYNCNGTWVEWFAHKSELHSA